MASPATTISRAELSYQFCQKNNISYKAMTQRNLENLPNRSSLFISFGEIDCRTNDGFILPSTKTGMQLEQIVQQTVVGYVVWFLEANLCNNHRYKFFNVPAAIGSVEISPIFNKDVARIICLYNAALKETLARHSLDLTDVYEPTKGGSGFSNDFYHCYCIHLDNRILGLIQDQM
jgi:hypothetical protein